MKHKHFKKLMAMLLVYVFIVGTITIPVSALPTSRTWTMSWVMAPNSSSTGTNKVWMGSGDTVSFNMWFNMPGVDFGIVDANGNFHYFSLGFSSPSSTYTMTVPIDGLYQVRVRNTFSQSVSIVGSSWTYTKRHYNWNADDTGSSNDKNVYFHSGTPSVVIDGHSQFLSTFTLSYVQTRISESVNEWNSTHDPVPVEFYPGSTIGNIFVRAGTPQHIYNQWRVDLGDGGDVVNGRAVRGSNRLEATHWVRGWTRNIGRIISTSYIYYANKHIGGTLIANGKTTTYNSRSVEGHKNTMKHEMGHILGFSGHTLDTNDLMTDGTSNSIERFVSAKNRDHITQFRRAYHNGTL